MKEIIQKDKLVELSYKIVDQKSGEVLTLVEFPVAYVQGTASVLAPEVTAELEGKSVGDIIEVPIDCNQLYGPRDETLVFTDRLENVPKEYQEIGLTITMENEKGDPKNFIVTRFDDETLTVDGNNPLCGREVIFKLEILSVRDATEEEIALGGKPDDDSAPEIEGMVEI
jgi:FKBP-type peptidyl-prolyl cis-trans isomerase SlyD